MSNRNLKQITFMMVVLLIYNYVASVSIRNINKYLPPAYQIDTSSISALLRDLKINGLQYGMSIIGYFLMYLLFVILLITIVLHYYHQLSIKIWLRNIHRGKIYVWIFILLLIFLPLNQFGLKIPIINYIPIPETFINMISITWMKICAGIIYFGLLFMVLRLRNTMYYLIVADKKLKSAIAKSWNENQTKKVSNIALLLCLLSQLLLTVVMLMIFQYLSDYLGNLDISITTANICIAFLTGMLYLVSAQWLLIFMTELNIRIKQKPSVSIQLLVVIAMMVTGGLSIRLSNRLLKKPVASQLIIAHMGVTSDNDVKNAIENLHKVSLTKPDYVEIDIQHTKDGIYVLSHDTVIKSINGKNYKINNTNWRKLKKVTYKSNGKKIKVSSFEDYLNEANKLNQRLLVELKINSTISNQELKTFWAKYGTAMEKNGSQVQSLNQNALKRLVKYTDITGGLLSPLNNTMNRDKINKFYAIEYSGVEPKTSEQAHNINKKLYAWTVDGHTNIMTMYAYGVDGFITNEPKKTRSYLKKIAKRPNYALVVWHSMLFKKTDF